MKKLTIALLMVLGCFVFLANTSNTAMAQSTVLRNIDPPPPNPTPPNTFPFGYINITLNDGGELEFGSGAFRLTATNNATSNLVNNIDLVYEYHSYVTTLNGTFRLSGNLTRFDASLAVSTNKFTGSNGNQINWTATTSLPPLGDRMTTAYTFTAVGGLPIGPMIFHQYLDEDVQGSGNDILLSAGLASAGNLSLFTVDNLSLIGVSHGGALLPQQGLQNATFLGWAADAFPFMRSEIVASEIDFTTNGIFSTINYSPTGTVNTARLAPLIHPDVGPAFGLGSRDPSSSIAYSITPTASEASFNTFLGGISGVAATLPNLIMSKTVSPANATGAAIVDYTLTVSNAGESATGILVEDDFPFEYFQFVSATNPNVFVDSFGGGFFGGTTGIDWFIPSLGPGESTSAVIRALTEDQITLSGLLPQGTSLITNIATVSDDQSNGPDANLVDNQSSAVLALEVDCTPDIVGCTPSEDFGCNPDFTLNPLPTLAQLEAGLFVFGGGVLGPVSIVDTGTCARSITYTWVASNGCGNTTCETAFTWFEIAGPPALVSPIPPQYQDRTLVCGEPPEAPDFLDFTATVLTNFCNPPVGGSVTQTLVVVGGVTNAIREYTAVDGCGQTISYTQTITIISIALPDVQILSGPTNLSLGCNPPTIPTTTGLLGQFVVQDGVASVVNAVTNFDGCTTAIDYLFEATNTCSSTQYIVQVTYVEDVDAPLAAASGPFVDRILACGEPLPALDPDGFGSNAIVDVCAVTLTATEAFGPAGPVYQPVFHTYTTTDLCGNSSVYTQTLQQTTSLDVPSIDCVNFLDLGCNPASVPDEADLIDMLNVANGVVLTLSNVISGTACQREANWMFRATNGCGFVDCAVLVRWSDPDGIVLANLSTDLEDQTLSCGTPPPNPDPNLVRSALQDACGQVDVNVTVNTSATTVRHVYSASDACNQTVEYTQTFTRVPDNDPPVLENLPTSLTLFGDAECKLELPFIAVRGIDECDGETIVSQNPIPGTPIMGPGSVLVTFTTEDSKGNRVQSTRQIPVSCGVVANGSISGMKFDDTNGNGVQDSDVVVQTLDPTIVILLDVSGSTIQSLANSPVGDLNNDGVAGTTLDTEISALIDFNASIQRRYPAARMVLIPFDSIAVTTPFGAARSTPPGAAFDAALRTVTAQGGTDYGDAFAQANAELAALSAMPAGSTVLLVTDGQSDQPFSVQLSSLQAQASSIQAFGLGPLVNLSALQSIDGGASSSSSAADLSAALLAASIPDSGPVNIGEGGMAGITIYVDLNNNNSLDGGEPSTVTDADGNWQLDNLLPGAYIVREVLPAGMTQTFPIGGSHAITLGSGGTVSGLDFGNNGAGGGGGPDPIAGKLQGLVWVDGSNNGSPDDENLTAFAQAGITVLLQTANGVQISSTTTDNDGRFCFDNLPAGSYIVALDESTVPVSFPDRSTPTQTGATVSTIPVADILFGLVAEDTAVELESYLVAEGSLVWTTGWEDNSLGFHVEHSINGLNWTRETDRLILSAGPARYEAAIDKAGFYRLIEIDNDLLITELDTIGYAPPVGEPTRTVIAESGQAGFETDAGHDTYLVLGLTESHAVYDTQGEAQVRLFGETLSGGTAAYFSWPAGRVILAK